MRTLGQLDAEYDISRKVHLNFGGLYFADKSIDLSTDETMLKMNNVAFYAQALLKHRLADAVDDLNSLTSGFLIAFIPFVERIAFTFRSVDNNIACRNMKSI